MACTTVGLVKKKSAIYIKRVVICQKVLYMVSGSKLEDDFFTNIPKQSAEESARIERF